MHAPLLRLPYFWDEAGYYIPAARDLLLTGSLIPHSTVSNAHPPLVMAWLALWWKVVGFSPIVTRTAMLVAAAFSLLGLFRLAERVANTQVAIAATLCTALYPVFFAQSSLAHVDLVSAGLIFWALSAYVKDEWIAASIWFALAALAKETAILAPLALAAWQIVGCISWRFFTKDQVHAGDGGTEPHCATSSAAPKRRMILGVAALKRCVKTSSAESGSTGREKTPGSLETGKGTSSTRAENASQATRLQPLRYASWQRNEFLRGLSSRSAASTRPITSLLLAAIPLALWYVYHYHHTGYVFGNPEFFRYNVASTLSPLRFVLALAMRLWQVLAYLHLWFLTLATLLAMWILPPLDEDDSMWRGHSCPRAGSARELTQAEVPAPRDPQERPRISIPIQMIFYVIVAAYVVAMALIGGAVLARYMLPAVPLIILVCVSTLWRRVNFWRAAIACVALAFFAGLFSNPHYGFSPEDNLAYRDYILMHEAAEQFLEARYPMARVLTAWPASDEITRPWLGYLTRPLQAVRIENFSLDELLSAAELRATDPQSNFEVALIFSTKYEPGPAPWDRWQKWNDWKSRYFDFHRDVPPGAAAQILAGKIVFEEQRQGQWVAVIQIERNGIESARLTEKSEIKIQK